MTAARFNNWNDIPHTVIVDDLFAADDSPAYEIDIPGSFDSFDDAADWIDDCCETHGIEREDFYISNKYAGGNAGNAISQGQIT